MASQGTQPPLGFGEVVKEIASAITQSLSFISSIADQFSKAVDDGYAILNKIKGEHLKNQLDLIKGQMSTINSDKNLLMESWRDYLNKDRLLAEPWKKLQDSSGSISLSLESLLSGLDDDPTVLVKGTDLVTASSLRSALARQGYIYKRVSELQEPQSTQEFEEVRGVVNQREDLLKKVIDLETNIGKLLKQH